MIQRETYKTPQRLSNDSDAINKLNLLPENSTYTCKNQQPQGISLTPKHKYRQSILNLQLVGEARMCGMGTLEIVIKPQVGIALQCGCSLVVCTLSMFVSAWVYFFLITSSTCPTSPWHVCCWVKQSGSNFPLTPLNQGQETPLQVRFLRNFVLALSSCAYSFSM